MGGVLIERAHYYTILVVGLRTIREDVLIEEGALTEAVRYSNFKIDFKHCCNYRTHGNPNFQHDKTVMPKLMCVARHILEVNAFLVNYNTLPFPLDTTPGRRKRETDGTFVLDLVYA